MTVFWRHLLLGLLSWVSGRVAISFSLYWPEPLDENLSSWPQLAMNRLPDWLTVALFRPLALFLAGACLVVSLWLPFHLAAVHARHLLSRRSMPTQEQLPHLVLLLFALVLLFFLCLKFAWGVCLVLFGWTVAASVRWRRQRTLCRRLARAEYRRGT